ncbi:MAG: hypothetical protein KF782_12790 [Labilithrix sp.]|nr:hypothetical protein [Labilithrix sp.]
MRASTVGVVVLALLLVACGRSGSGTRSAEMRSFRATGAGAGADPTLRPARLLPEDVDATTTYGAEAGGGSRVLTAGLRVVTYPKGAIVAAQDRLPQAPQTTIALPDRLGGGFLFVLGTTLWRADRWLGPAKPIFTSSSPLQAILPGLDRVYLRAQNTVLAIDGRSGQVLDLGPWPASPFVASYAAADGWRAAAVTDMRGVVATFDAGATWKSLDLPLEPKEIVVSSDALAIGGFESGRAESWYELRADGSVARLGAPPREAKTALTPTIRPAPHASMYPPTSMRPPPPPASAPARADGETRADADKEDVAARTFGKRPLATAIEDGWPLTDGTAVIARDGALARVRLSDGALLELVRDAFPLESARCHPVSLARPRAAGAFGFVCGEPRGKTVLYAYEPRWGRLAELKSFDRPRVVTSSGNGALAVRGPCAEDGEPPPPPRPEPAKLEKEKSKEELERAKDPAAKSKGKAKEEARAGAEPEPPEAKVAGEPARAPRPPVNEVHPYCVLGHDDTWREIHVRGDVGGERVVVLADGRIVVVSPPQGLGTPARLTLLDRAGGSARATTVPIVFPRVTNDVGRVLRLGLWLDGFEERRPGVVGGWIEAGGVMLGVEIALDGKATPGQYIRDAGMPFVAGRYGLGWTASRRGYETTDGGMTWSPIDLPDPLVPAARVERRACGPIGCLAHGWLRVGWGESGASPPPVVPPPPYRSTTAPPAIPQLNLACEPMASMPQAAATPRAKSADPVAPQSRVRLGGFGGPPVLSTFNGLSELPPFFAQAAPALRESERGVNVDVREHVERYVNVGSLARVYGWGPKTGEWETLGRWQVKWLSPFAGWPEVRASLPAPPPQVILDMTRASTTYYGYGVPSSGFQLAQGDDAAHALLVGKRAGRAEGLLYELEAERAPIEVRRADGEPFGELEGVVRAAGRWFIASPSSGAAAPTTLVWQIEGGVARELVRVPRASASVSSSARTRLASRSDGRAIALVVDGQPTAERSTSVRWALPIDLESGALGEPEPLGYVDLAGRTLDACTDDVVGWVLDATMPASSVRVRVPQGGGALSSVLARLRLTRARACVERVAGTYEGQSQERAAQLTRAGAGAARTTAPLRSGELYATVMSAQHRFPLKCSVDRAPR